MSTSVGDVSPDTSPGKSSSSAERMRRYRERQRREERIIRVHLGPIEIKALVARRFLQPDELEDTSAIEFAMSAFIDETLGMLNASQ